MAGHDERGGRVEQEKKCLNSREILGGWEAQLPLLNSVFIFNRVEMAELSVKDVLPEPCKKRP